MISGILAWWFWSRLGIDYVSFSADFKRHVGIFAPLFSFFLTIAIVNAINISDGLDGLAGGTLLIVL